MTETETEPKPMEGKPEPLKKGYVLVEEKKGYVLVEEKNVDMFMIFVTRYLNEGYELHGPRTTHDTHCSLCGCSHELTHIQTLVKLK